MMPIDRDAWLAALHEQIAIAMDSALAHTRRSLGPSAWYGVELRVGVDGGPAPDSIDVVHQVGLRGKDPNSLQVWGEGPNVDAAIDQALEESKPRRPRGWRRG